LFLELEAQVDGLLFKAGDLLVERVDVGGDAVPGLLPSLVKTSSRLRRLGQGFGASASAAATRSPARTFGTPM
jgi:hypothetical protein